ncbi:hypothetical protein MASR2M17_16590 [Aminivibrio sp.]
MRGKFRLQKDYVYTRCRCTSGGPFYPARVVYPDMTVLAVKYQTDEDALLQFIPDELLEPSVNLQFTNCREIEWMSG